MAIMSSMLTKEARASPPCAPWKAAILDCDSARGVSMGSPALVVVVGAVLLGSCPRMAPPQHHGVGYPRSALRMDYEDKVTQRRSFSPSSKKKFELLEAQAAREPTDRSAVLIVGGGLFAGLVGVLVFAATNGYLTVP